MNLIALLIGILIERLATQLFHWRRLRWLDRVIDWGFDQAARFGNVPPLIPIVALAALLALPVLVVVLALGDALLGFAYLALAIVVLFFSLGPRDIGEEVDEYCEALEAEDSERIAQTAKALAEGPVPTDTLDHIRSVEAAVCVQANNRLFAVIFWFMLLGPLGAWVYRVTDLIRRRAVFNATRAVDESERTAALRDAGTMLHGWLAFVPARLTAIGYAVAGHFDAALAAWREGPEEPPTSTSQASEELLARVGAGALALGELQDETTTERGVRGARAANTLVFRLLMIWAVIIAALTLYGWSI